MEATKKGLQVYLGVRLLKHLIKNHPAVGEMGMTVEVTDWDAFFSDIAKALWTVTKDADSPMHRAIHDAVLLALDKSKHASMVENNSDILDLVDFMEQNA